MNDRRYTILDNFKQVVNDFDVVASSACKQGCQVSELGLYWGTIVFILNDFDKMDSVQASVTLRRNTLWNTGRNTSLVNRVEVEAGMMQGTFQMKNIIKIGNLNEELMDFRVKIITLIEEGKVANNIPRKILVDMLDDAKMMGYI